MSAPIVIAGSGLAGFAVAREFRKRDAATPVIMISADDGSYYSKPTLSNALRAGTLPRSLVIQPADAMAAQLRLELCTRSRIERIDLQARMVYLADRQIEYGKLVLALGADPVAPSIEGDAAHEVIQVNDLAAYAQFRVRLDGVKHVVIIGAGLVGCEFANDIASTGIAVTVIDLFGYPLARFCPTECAEALHDSLAAIGVRWRLNASVRRLDRHAGKIIASLADGEAIECDLVLAAVGLRPRLGLARAAGLQVARGICTDSRLATSADDVFAIGDCSEVNGQWRPFVMPIVVGARSLGATISGHETSFDYPFMPIVVKTPACPMVLLPPEGAAVGDWHVDGPANDRTALFRDRAGAIRGFALVGAASRHRQSLLAEMSRCADGAASAASAALTSVR